MKFCFLHVFGYKGAGMAVLVHDNSELPSVDTGAMLLNPGRHHKLSYTKKISTYLSSPYTDCTDKINRGMEIMYASYVGTNYGYSKYQCFSACLQAYM